MFELRRITLRWTWLYRLTVTACSSKLIFYKQLDEDTDVQSPKVAEFASTGSQHQDVWYALKIKVKKCFIYKLTSLRRYFYRSLRHKGHFFSAQNIHHFDKNSSLRHVTLLQIRHFYKNPSVCQKFQKSLKKNQSFWHRKEHCLSEKKLLSLYRAFLSKWRVEVTDFGRSDVSKCRMSKWCVEATDLYRNDVSQWRILGTGNEWPLIRSDVSKWRSVELGFPTKSILQSVGFTSPIRQRWISCEF